MSFLEAGALLQLLRGYLTNLLAGPSAMSACLAQCGEALARLEHRLRGAGRVTLWAAPQHTLFKALLELSCCLMESELQVGAAAAHGAVVYPCAGTGDTLRGAGSKL
jgi:hypothetical protein